MKILIITSGMFPVSSPKSASIETLVTNLIDYNEIEGTFQFTVATKKDDFNSLSSKEYKYTDFIFYEKLHKFNFIYKLWAVLYYICRIFHLNIPKYHYIWEIFKSTKITEYDYIVIEEGDPWAFNFFSSVVGRDKMIYHSHSIFKINKHFEKIYEHIIFTSDFLRISNTNNNPLYLDSGYTLLNCINEKYFLNKLSSHDKKILKESMQINEKDVVFLFVGRITPDKGVLELIQAWNLLHLSNAKLLLIGSALFDYKTLTEYEIKVKKQVDNSSNIRQIGFVPQDQLYKYHQISDIFVAPSEMESAGLMNVEALYSCLPIISVNCGGIPEYIIPNQNAILISKYDNINELANSMNLLFDNLELRNSLSHNNEVDRFNFSARNYYINFAKIIRKINAK